MFHEQESRRSESIRDLTVDQALKLECLVILLRTPLKEGEEGEEGQRTDPDSRCLYETHDTSLEPA
jgi:hypothetical protein